MTSHHAHFLTIVIPALNEEESIGSTISRTLAAKEYIKNSAGLRGVELIVVSDGSTDRTAEIARSFKDVTVIIFERNRGYGAAIKEGWKQGEGDLLGFLDADGTCDPAYFAEMCRASVHESADVVIGSRLGPESKMPMIRMIGNRIYAFLLGMLCGKQVTDTASGMRVVRRSSLKWLYPLPDGLHFTPSMSARALLNDLTLVEIPMSYAERIGQSKLHVLRDGVLFFKTIFSGVLNYRPENILLAGFSLSMVMIIILAASPVEFYFREARLEEWMIYRFVVCFILGSFGLMLLLSTALTYNMAFFSPRRKSANAFWPYAVANVLRGPGLFVLLSGLCALSLAFLWPGAQEFVNTGHVSMHWSRLLAGAFSLSCSLQTAVFALLLKVVAVWKAQSMELDTYSLSSQSSSSADNPASGRGRAA